MGRHGIPCPFPTGSSACVFRPKPDCWPAQTTPTASWRNSSKGICPRQNSTKAKTRTTRKARNRYSRDRRAALRPMPKKYSQRAEDLRRALAQEAARIMAEHGIEDFLQAKRKAADRLGVNDVAVLPKNIEIEDALRAHQRLFGRDTHVHTLREQRRIALDTMRILAEFQPRLVGSVLTGTATTYSDINLHLFDDASESVAIKLLEIGVPHEFYERRVKMDAERSVNYPALRFEANGRTVDATVFPIDGIRQSPYSPVDGRPMKRADAREVSELVDSN